MKRLIYFLFAALSPSLSKADWFSDFDGPWYDPWSGISEGVNFKIRFTNSQLHVTRIYVNNGQLQYGYVGLARFFEANGAPQANFRLSARVGWDVGEYQDMYLGFTGNSFQGVISDGFVGYTKRPGQSGQYHLRMGQASEIRIAAPNTGLHIFEMEYIGLTAKIWIDGNLVYNQFSSMARPINEAVLLFGGPDSSQFAPLHVDWAEYNAVPEPASVSLLSALAASYGLRRARERR